MSVGIVSFLLINASVVHKLPVISLLGKSWLPLKRLRGRSNSLRARKEDQGIESPVPAHARPSIPHASSLILVVEAVPLINDAFGIAPERAHSARIMDLMAR